MSTSEINEGDTTVIKTKVMVGQMEVTAGEPQIDDVAPGHETRPLLGISSFLLSPPRGFQRVIENDRSTWPLD